jgi:fucose 4-O-acetylase-like acetyltransferase
MPFFFMISGCLYKVREGGLIQAITINVKKLLIPYLCLNIFCAIVYSLIAQNPIRQLLKLTYGIVIGGFTPSGASWFVIVLFFIKCLYDFLSYKKVEKIAIPLIFVLTIIINYFPPSHNFFYFKSVLIGICFFHLGRVSFSLVNKANINTFASLIISVALFIVSYNITRLNGRVSLFAGTMGNSPLMFYGNAIIGSLGIISLSFFTKKQNKTITEMSNASIAVVLLHMIFVDGTRICVKHFDISGVTLFVLYLFCSVVIYYLCFIIFKFTNKKIPFIWGK